MAKALIPKKASSSRARTPRFQLAARIPIRANAECALDFVGGCTFSGKVVPTSPENALGDETSAFCASNTVTAHRHFGP
jgi:hypothetical protein